MGILLVNLLDFPILVGLTLAMFLLSMIFFTKTVEPTPKAVEPATVPATITVPYFWKMDSEELSALLTTNGIHFTGLDMSST